MSETKELASSNICAACGEPMDEYLDCLENESHRHVSEASVEKFLNRMREMAASRQRRISGASQKGDPRE